MSRSAFMARRTLAVRLESLPRIAAALGTELRSAHIGVEAALQLVRVAQGGSDNDDNVASVCVWCHLLGIHGGRIRAKGRVAPGGASQIRWELGGRGEPCFEQPCLVVEGRERTVAALRPPSGQSHRR